MYTSPKTYDMDQKDCLLSLVAIMTTYFTIKYSVNPNSKIEYQNDTPLMDLESVNLKMLALSKVGLIWLSHLRP